MDLDAATRSWIEDGFVVLPGYLPATDLAPAVDELGLLFPSAADFHDGADPDRNARFVGDEFDGIDGFPFASLALNRVPVCDALVELATTLLGTPDIRLYSAEAWAKYEGAADYDQDLHRDLVGQVGVVDQTREVSEHRGRSSGPRFCERAGEVLDQLPGRSDRVVELVGRDHPVQHPRTGERPITQPVPVLLGQPHELRDDRGREAFGDVLDPVDAPVPAALRPEFT